MQVLRRTDKAMPQHVRQSNTRLVLQRVSEGLGQVSRADLVRVTGLNTGTISAVVTDLLDRELLVEAGVGPSAGGKPPVLLDLDESRYSVLALQVARSGYRLAEVTLRGTVLQERHGRLSSSAEPDEIARSLAAAVTAAADPTREPIALGVAVPGTVDGNGTVTRSVTMEWSDVELRPALSARLALPTHLLNDARSSALAEATLAAAGGETSLVALYIGDGVGAGLVLEGRLFAGESSGAGEVGHINLRTHDLRCECGRTGCLEAAATLRVLTGRETPELGDTVWAGQRLDRRAGRRAARNIVALMELNHDLLDVRHTVVCGPVCHLGTGLIDLIRSELADSQLYREGRISIALSELGDRGALLGAATFAAHAELGLLWTSTLARARTGTNIEGEVK